MIQTADCFENIIDEYYTINEFLGCVCEKWASNTAIEYLVKNERIKKSYAELDVDRKRVGDYLHNHYPKGTHIAIIGKTSYFWLCSYFGIVGSENVAVPIDKELPKEDILELLTQGDVTVVFCDKKYDMYLDTVREKYHVLLLDEHFFDETFPINDEMFEGKSQPEDVAEIVFTSGTTGKSKGCMLSHKNLAWNAMNGFSYVRLFENDVALSVLPINHALEVAAGILTPLCSGMRICINDSLKHMQKNMQLYKPSCMVVVPLILQTFHQRIWNEIRKTGKEKIVRKLMKISNILPNGLRRKVFKTVIDGLGGEMRLFVVGGAFIEPEIIKDFQTWGIMVIQGYGITECAPVVACNSEKVQSSTSVGKVVTNCEVKIQDGEILVRGSNVMKGYYKDKTATDEVFDGEWLKTGDLGYIDDQGSLYLTGRKKNLIILPNGENVSPEGLEIKIEQFPEVTEVIVKEKNGKVTAEIFCEENFSEETKQIIAQRMNEMNSKLPVYQHVTAIEYRTEPFEKTTTRKIKRYSN